MRRLVAALLAGLVVTSSFICRPARQPSRALNVPILLYHRLGPLGDRRMTVRPPWSRASSADQGRGPGIPCAYGGLTTSPKRRRWNVRWCWSPMTATAASIRTVPSDQTLPGSVTLFIYPSAISNPSAPYAMTWEQLAEMKASGAGRHPVP